MQGKGKIWLLIKMSHIWVSFVCVLSGFLTFWRRRSYRKAGRVGGEADMEKKKKKERKQDCEQLTFDLSPFSDFLVLRCIFIQALGFVFRLREGLLFIVTLRFYTNTI